MRKGVYKKTDKVMHKHSAGTAIPLAVDEARVIERFGGYPPCRCSPKKTVKNRG